MKIGPNHHDPAAMSRPNEELAKGQSKAPVRVDPVAGAKGNHGSEATGQPIDTLHLSAPSDTGSERVGYDTYELRDRLAAARNLNKDRPADAVISGKTDSAKLNTIRQLVESGFYEREEVKHQIADKLADLFIGGDSQQEDRQ